MCPTSLKCLCTYWFLKAVGYLMSEIPSSLLCTDVEVKVQRDAVAQSHVVEKWWS